MMQALRCGNKMLVRRVMLTAGVQRSSHSAALMFHRLVPNTYSWAKQFSQDPQKERSQKSPEG